ncbi:MULTISPECIES: phosphatase [Clostridium]|uniref:phosphatase n=1 Tax=Clostridium TaxID=1485 RepID=UPI0002CB6139|nr:MULTISPECIES: phosphatase [Clostridium]ALP89588.1 hydrolase [Clostridium butyricum]ALS16043.1 hydrolase [Clostridium butyricum]ANF13201.1 phosphatase [Clostridium butyricum]AOR93272.1 phosphatase [Clostridium butyricum]AXB85793.1 phosphatase [Clostridium butyricum]
MKYALDVHTHTIVSGHAYSTLMENAKAASEKGIKVLGTTEHGCTMPNAPHIWYFNNYKVLPREMYGVKMLYGVEANIIDYEGNLDMDDDTLGKLDIVIGSIHDEVYKVGNAEENTAAFINVIKSGKVDIIGHLGNPTVPVNFEEVIKCAKENNVLIEINNSSFTTSRIGSLGNCTKIAKICKEYGNTIIINSDAHFCTKIGEFTEAITMLESIDFPENYIINSNPDMLLALLREKGRLK